MSKLLLKYIKMIFLACGSFIINYMYYYYYFFLILLILFSVHLRCFMLLSCLPSNIWFWMLAYGSCIYLSSLIYRRLNLPIVARHHNSAVPFLRSAIEMSESWFFIENKYYAKVSENKYGKFRDIVRTDNIHNATETGSRTWWSTSFLKGWYALKEYILVFNLK